MPRGKYRLDPKTKGLVRSIFPPKGRFYCSVCGKEKPLSEKVDFSVKGAEALCQEVFSEKGLGGTLIPMSCCSADYKQWSEALKAKGFEIFPLTSLKQ